MKHPPESGSIELTLGARRHAERLGLLDALGAALLPSYTQVDDLVEWGAAKSADAFIVRMRKLALDASGCTGLVLVLDHPPRPTR